jgi:caspase domain-containing protein
VWRCVFDRWRDVTIFDIVAPMSGRSALLIGVSPSESQLFAAIHGVVASDVRRMDEVLTESGYGVTHCGAGETDGPEPTRTRIRNAIARAVRDAPDGGVLVVYFSGHGVIIDGRGWLVPSDVDTGGEPPDPDSLVPLVPVNLIGCRARLVLFVVDACRNDLADALSEAARSTSQPCPDNGAFVLVTSCSAGQRSLYGDDGSYFTQVLAEVLDRRSAERSLGAVYREVERKLARRVALTDGIEQRPDVIRTQHGNAGEPVDATIICEGDEVGQAWRLAVESSPVWRLAAVAPSTVDRLRRTILTIVDDAARRWLEARATLAEKAELTDLWSAQNYPARVLSAFAQLMPDDARLDAAELLIVVASPFVREVALSGGLQLAAGIQPQRFDRTYADGPRSDLEITHAMHDHIGRRAEGLARRGGIANIATRDVLAMWLVHRWLAERSSLWEEPSVAAMAGRVANTLVADDTDLTSGEVTRQLLALVRCIDADASDPRAADCLPGQPFERRMRTLGVALWLAGILAADPRRLPAVVVDHVGIGDDLPLSAVHAATVKAAWQRDGERFTLHAVCEHPALYDAFDSLARRADETARVLRHLDLDPALARAFPTGFGTAALRPEVGDSGPLFEAPPLRFRLSSDKVRELLMGRTLYGEPDLAIRELYQNALDACRYRRARREYLARTDQPVGGWRGSITLSQGVDATGREYIDCVDNGVGMSRETLENTFANAGERFVYRSGFRAEHARWQDLTPPLRLVPNSQFGVGVFSYFMIAEEILITTRAVGEDDVVSKPAHSVRIASSGSLFRITTSADMPTGGTRVRLYLTGEDRLSVLRTMRRLLWVAEFEVTVTDADATAETWTPDRLRYPGATVDPLQYGDDLWWVPGNGGLAADGIRTNEERHGLVVNLRDVRRPQFTVDRNRLREWDRNWIAAEVHASLPELNRWPGLTLGWLWKVAERTPAIAEMIFAWLVTNNRDIRIEGVLANGRLPLAARVGCLPIDVHLFSGDMATPHTPAFWWLAAWRIGAWKGTFTFTGVANIPEAASLAGFPIVTPLDASVISALYNCRQRYGPVRFGRPTADDILEALADEEETPPERLRRAQQYAITGLDLRAARDLPPVRGRFRDERRPFAEGYEHIALLRAVAAWTPPGCPPRRAVGGWLSYASSELHIPLGEVIRRVTAIVPPDWTAPDVGHLRDEVFSWNDLSIFARNLYAAPPWIDASVSPAHVVRVSGKLGVPVGQVLTMFDRFAPLGYEVQGRAVYPAELTQLELETLRYAESFGWALTPLHMFLLANRTGDSVSAVRRGLAPLAARGFVSLPAADPHPDATPTDDEITTINETLLVYNSRLDRAAPATGWLAVHRLAARVSGREARGLDGRVARFRRLLDVVDLLRPVTMPEIIDLVYFLDYTVSEAINLYATLYPHADLSTLPPVAFGSTAACHRWEHGIALTGTYQKMNHGHHDTHWALTPGDIARGAAGEHQPVRAFLASLEPFRELGAPLPTIADNLSERPADRYDVAMLHERDEYGYETPISVIAPLWLVQSAGRFGWTVAQTYRRLAEFVPLGLTIEGAQTACPDRIVTWQDLLVLTEFLDGHEPALSGDVGEAHIAAAANDIGETREQVVARLAPYAALVGFRLP